MPPHSTHTHCHVCPACMGLVTLKITDFSILIRVARLRKPRFQISVGDKRSWDLFLDIKFCFFGNFFIFACDRLLLHSTETLFWMCAFRLEIRQMFFLLKRNVFSDLGNVFFYFNATKSGDGSSRLRMFFLCTCGHAFNGALLASAASMMEQLLGPVACLNKIF